MSVRIAYVIVILACALFGYFVLGEIVYKNSPSLGNLIVGLLSGYLLGRAYCK